MYDTHPLHKNNIQEEIILLFFHFNLWILVGPTNEQTTQKKTHNTHNFIYTLVVLIVILKSIVEHIFFAVFQKKK